MTHLLVTVGTDGRKDWVRTPDGQKLALGSISVLTFVSKLAKNSRIARNTLDQFLKGGEAMFKVDSDRMWRILEPRRARWASDGSFMLTDQRQANTPTRTVMTLDDILTKTEKVMAYCSKQAAAGNPIDPQAFKDLETSARKLAMNQSDNAAFYGVGVKLERPEEGFANEEHSPAGMVELNKGASELSFDTYDENMRLAKAILDESTQTVATINKLAAKGKRFNKSAALKDVAGVTNKVASICEKTALTEDWVTGDLQKLASESSRIHQLFHPKGR